MFLPKELVMLLHWLVFQEKLILDIATEHFLSMITFEGTINVNYTNF